MLEQPEVIIGVMKDDLDVGIGQCRGQGRQAGHGERIHHGGLLPGGELQQVDAIVEPMKAGGLGVDRQEWLALESPEELLELSLAVDQADGHFIRLGDQLEAGGNLVECLGQRLVELGVRLRGASHGCVHLKLPGKAGGVADVVGRWFHGSGAAGPRGSRAVVSTVGSPRT